MTGYAVLMWSCFVGAPSICEAATIARPRLVLIGDSTVKNGSGKGEGGLWGWGQVLAEHFDTTRIEVENHALGGRSSRTFLTEGLWERVLARVRPGDFVLMQFGHNDGGEKFEGNRPRASIKGNGDQTVEGVVEMTGKREIVHSYGWYLRRYINDTQEKRATPIVVSLVPRDRWKEGQVIRANTDYGRWAKEAAEQAGAAFIDLNELAASSYEELGEEYVGSKLFPAEDWTHTTLAGARVNAECLVQGIRDLADQRLATFLESPRDTSPSKALWRFRFQGDTASNNDGSSEGFRTVHRFFPYSSSCGYGRELVPLTGKPKASKGIYFAAAVPPGNYKITVTAGGKGMMTIKAELRRLLVENWEFGEEEATHEFSVNVRMPDLQNGGSVRLKPREKTKEAWAWDEKLTLEFLGDFQKLRTLTIEPAEEVATIYLAGDSTVCDQPVEPWASWGQMLPRFFDSSVVVANHAESGESVRGSLGARRFDKIFELIRTGDYLFLQFGHNDMKDTSEGALARYEENLRKLVQKTRQLGATPVLVTSMERKPGEGYRSLKDYPDTVRRLAGECGAALIDLNRVSNTLYEALGEGLELAFQDGTHHTNYGSYLFAQAVIQGIIDNELPLAEAVTEGFQKFNPGSPLSHSDFAVVPSGRSEESPPPGS